MNLAYRSSVLLYSERTHCNMTFITEDEDDADDDADDADDGNYILREFEIFFALWFLQ